MAKNLLIVESPAKAKTIEKILGSDFEVKSCFGHIRDLEKEDMGIDIKNNFQPRYKVSDDKERVVKDLRASAKKSGEVWLATDEDREGEAISWHLCEVLNLDPHTTKRIVFHEITKPAIQKAVKNPRTVNMDLVNAQQARRILDRIVGFEISPILWRKMSMRNNLSAGRVQSVAVRLIVERERSITKFNSVSSFKVEALFSAPGLNDRMVTFKADGPDKMEDAVSAKAYLEKCIGATYKVADVQVKPAKKSPSAPFTTSTLQQEASRKLGYSVSRTMQIAQRLYENGHITYMRTDSVNISETAMDSARTAILSQYGENYHQQRKFQNKNASAQEAHEAIRPTDMMVQRAGDADQQKLYELIWKRTMASQMADAQLERTIAKITVSAHPEPLTATGEVLRFDGFLKVYSVGLDEEDVEEGGEGILPPLTPGQQPAFQEMNATQKFTRPQPRFTEASLVKKLEELGIGRPSTYAPTISTIQTRTYVERRDKEGVKREFGIVTLKNNQVTSRVETENTGAERSKLFPTDLGMVVTDFLSEHFQTVMDYNFTARIEAEFDEIANGKQEWSKMLGEFYEPFHEQVAQTMEHAGRAKGEHILGDDPVSGKPVVARLGRFGPMIQIGGTEDEEKPRFATLKANQSIETITLDEAMDLFKLPLTLGMYQDKEVVVNNGRYGPYIKWGEAFVSLPKGEEPLSVDLERATALIDEKQLADAPVGFFKGEPVTKGKGRFGPFIKWGDLYINIPKAYNFDALTQLDIDELVGKKLEKEAARYLVQWETEKIALENGRWGPFIRFGKKMLKLDRKADGEKYTNEEAADIPLEIVKKMIEAQMPGAFDKKTKAPAKKAATSTTKKTVAKKTTLKKASKKSTAPSTVIAAKKTAVRKK